MINHIKMIRYLGGAPKVKVFERDIRNKNLSDAELIKRRYQAWLDAQQWGNNDDGGGNGGHNPYIPDPPSPGEDDGGNTGCGDFNLDFNYDFWICETTQECGSFNSAFNKSFHICTDPSYGGDGDGVGSFNEAHNYSFDVYELN